MRYAFLFFFVVVISTACAALPSTSTPSPIPPTRVVLPASEDAVPRVTVQEAKAALDSGEAIILDVRSEASFARAHITGAINFPLSLIERNAANLQLKKDRWIITYCT